MKTMSKKEFDFLQVFVGDYYRHLKANPNTLITRYFGLHELIQGDKGTSIYFVIMNNSFNTSLHIPVRYDLKGSTHGRKVIKTPNQIVYLSLYILLILFNLMYYIGIPQ